jgi:signal transduction histidine kinase
MSDRLRENYFVFVRLALMVVLCGYGAMSESEATGVSVGILLLVSFYIGVMATKELFRGPIKIVMALVGVVLNSLLVYYGGREFLLLGFCTLFEVLSLFPALDYRWYFASLLGAWIETPLGFLVQLVVVFTIMILYIQHNYIVAGYRKRMREDVVTEQNLKKDIREREHASREEIRKSMLLAENQILEERASLSQTLHDKLGHNINGSIYQLEGVKVLMEKDPEKSRAMTQAVIDQLRTGMDEIRGILRKERPEKRELALLQLYKLCEDCNSKGVETEFGSEGELSLIGDELWEVILDNAFEAVSNSMKYAHCSHIDIRIVVMNKMVRCSIRDDGVGCKEIHDGMGISGMRQRVRAVGGTLSFETEAGFTVTMLLPL